MTERDLDELERLERAATPGPWFEVKMGTVWLSVPMMAGILAGSDAAFIASARNALPALIARVRELEVAAKKASEFMNMRPEQGLRAWRDADRALRHVLNGDPLLPGDDQATAPANPGPEVKP